MAAPWLWLAVRDTTPLLELVAVTLPLLAVAAIAALVGLAVARARWFAAPAASVLVLAVVAVVGPWLPRDTGEPATPGTTVAVANVLRDNRSAEAVVDDILAQDADVVVVPEASLAVHQLLDEAYAYTVRPDRRDPVMGVYARIPIAAPVFVPGLLANTRQQRIEVHGPGGDFVLWAVHLPRPWVTTDGNHQMRPPGHAAKLEELLDAFAAEDEDVPVVVAGDANLTDRGRAYHRMTKHFDDALRGTWGGPTARKWFLRPLLLRVDHVFVPEDWCADGARRFALSGSDHRGVAVRVGPCV